MKGKKVMNTGLGVIGDIGKKTYNILMEDDDDSNTGRRTNVCVPFVFYRLLSALYCILLRVHVSIWIEIFRIVHIVVATEVKGCSLLWAKDPMVVLSFISATVISLLHPRMCCCEPQMQY